MIVVSLVIAENAKMETEMSIYRRRYVHTMSHYLAVKMSYSYM